MILLLVVLAVAGCSVQCGTPTVEEEETAEVTPPAEEPSPPAEGGTPVAVLETGDQYDEESGQITNKTAEFTPETKAMHISASLSGLQKGQKITGKLIAVDVTSSEGEKITDTEVLATDVTAPGEKADTHFTFSAPDAGWPKGAYEGLILVEGEEIASVDLMVK